MYPILAPNVFLHIETDENGCNTYYVCPPDTNVCDELTVGEYDVLNNADGTHPIKDSEFLQRMEQKGVITRKRFVRQKGILNYFIIAPLVVRANNGRITGVCRFLNRYLTPGSFLIFIFGKVMHEAVGESWFMEFSTGVYVALVLLALATHELGHIIAILSFGQQSKHFGIPLLWILPVGAYVFGKGDETVTPAERIKINLAGVELQAVYTGILYLLACVLPVRSEIHVAALVSTTIMILNLLPGASMLDGEKAMSCFVGVDSISAIARAAVIHEEVRVFIASLGDQGKRIMMSCMSVYISWLIIALGIIQLISVF